MIRLLTGDCRVTLGDLEPGSVQAAVTSVPYYQLRSYLATDDPLKPFEIGLEKTPELWLEHLVDVFGKVRRVLRDDGCLFVNCGDSYAGSGKGPSNSIQADASQIGPSAVKKRGLDNLASTPTEWVSVPSGMPAKNLMMMPSRLAMALQSDGWILRSMMPWIKYSAMPESCRDRPSTAVEYWFLFSKGPRYFWDPDAVRVDSPRNEFRTGTKRLHLGTIPPGHPTEAHPDKHHNGLMNGGGRETSRNMRNSDLFTTSWQGLMLDDQDDPLALVVNPAGFAGSHFATFPTKLVEPLIKASTSEKGACPECGAPWARETEKEVRTNGAVRTHIAGDTAPWKDGWGDVPRASLSVSTVGWRPSCGHSEALTPRPCVVLDPFGGSGTTGLVADRLGRDAILCELSDSYGGMATDRLVGDAPMFTQVEVA